MKILNLLIFLILFTFVVSAQNKNINTNTHFSVSENTVCTGDTIFIENFHQSNGFIPTIFQTTGYNYSWDFGNGQTSNLENPEAISYNLDGAYNMLYDVIIDTIGFKLTEITINNFSCDDVTSLNDPDIYIVIKDGDDNTVFDNSNSYVTTDSGPITFYMDILLNNPPYFVKVMDEDSGDANDNCIDGAEHDGSTVLDDYFSMNNESGFGINTFNKVNGGLNFDYTLNKVVYNYSANEIINVYQSIPDSFAIFANSDTIFANISADNYVWYFNNNEISGENDSLIIVTENGDYYCQAINMNFCTENSNTITLNNTFVEDIFNSSISIFPNPVSNLLNIKNNNFAFYDYINIYNIYGKLIIKKQVENNIETIDLSEFKQGIYLISYISKTKIYTKKIIKK